MRDPHRHPTLPLEGEGAFNLQQCTKKKTARGKIKKPGGPELQIRRVVGSCPGLLYLMKSLTRRLNFSGFSMNMK